MARIRIAYVGLPLGALALVKAGFAPEVICLGHPDAPGGRRVRRALGKSALVLAKPDLRAASVQAAIASARTDVLLSWFWPQRIPSELLGLHRLGAYGAHPSLLPRWRGPDPYFWAIHAGDLETGVTLHRLDEEYDTGAVIQQRRLTIRDADNAWSLARRLDRLGLGLLLEAAKELQDGAPLAGVLQDECLATPAPSPDDELLSIDWQNDAASIVRLVRAASPYPAATTELGEALVEVLTAEPFDEALPAALLPADAVLVGDRLVIKAAHGAVVIRKARTEAGSVLVDGQLTALFGEPLARV